MSRTRPGGVPAGLAWVVGLAAFGWVGLGLTGAPDPPDAVLPAAVADVSTAPKVFGTADGGWFHEPMTFSWTAHEDDSGIASCYDEFVKKVNTSWTPALHITCVDHVISAGPRPGLFRRYDGTAPTLDPVAVPGVVVRGGVVTVRPRGTDGLSGIDSQGCNGGRAPATRDVGLHSVGCFARDRAGNEATASVSYLVVAGMPRGP